VTRKNIVVHRLSIAILNKVLKQATHPDIALQLALADISAHEVKINAATCLSLAQNKKYTKDLENFFFKSGSLAPFDVFLESLKQLEKTSIPCFFHEQIDFDQILYQAFKEQTIASFTEKFPHVPVEEDFHDYILWGLIQPQQIEDKKALHDSLLLFYANQNPFFKQLHVEKELDKLRILNELKYDYIFIDNPDLTFDFFVNLLDSLQTTYEKTDIILELLEDFKNTGDVIKALKLLSIGKFTEKFLTFNDNDSEDEDADIIDPQIPFIELEHPALRELLFAHLEVFIDKITKRSEFLIAQKILENKCANGLVHCINFITIEEKINALESSIK
jgi:hypothetical protein